MDWCWWPEFCVGFFAGMVIMFSSIMIILHKILKD